MSLASIIRKIEKKRAKRFKLASKLTKRRKFWGDDRSGKIQPLRIFGANFKAR